jgi:hypothetical protein
MVFGPVDPGEDLQNPVPLSRAFVQVKACAGHTRSLMAGLLGPTSHQPFVTPVVRRALGLTWSLGAPVAVRGDSCRRLEWKVEDVLRLKRAWSLR